MIYYETEQIQRKKANKLSFESKEKVLGVYRLASKNQSNPVIQYSMFQHLREWVFITFVSAKKISKPVCTGTSPVIVLDEVKYAQNEQSAKRKLNILITLLIYINHET